MDLPRVGSFPQCRFTKGQGGVVERNGLWDEINMTPNPYSNYYQLWNSTQASHFTSLILSFFIRGMFSTPLTSQGSVRLEIRCVKHWKTVMAYSRCSVEAQWYCHLPSHSGVSFNATGHLVAWSAREVSGEKGCDVEHSSPQTTQQSPILHLSLVLFTTGLVHKTPHEPPLSGSSL